MLEDEGQKIHLGNVVVINFSRNDEIYVGEWVAFYVLSKLNGLWCYRLFYSHTFINCSGIGQSTQQIMRTAKGLIHLYVSWDSSTRMVSVRPTTLVFFFFQMQSCLTEWKVSILESSVPVSVWLVWSKNWAQRHRLNLSVMVRAHQQQ